MTLPARLLVIAWLLTPSTWSVAQTAPATPQPLYPSQGPLADRIATIVQAPGVARAHWGVAVTTMDGTPLFGLNEAQYFRPASNAKLFTTAAAMALLGPDRRFTTKVVARGALTGGMLRGDLVLFGGGDANFAGGYSLPYVSPAKRPQGAVSVPARPALADVDELAAKVAATGLKVITGDVVGEDAYFDNTPYPEGWSVDDMLWGYGAPVSALSIHDNQIDLAITAGPTPKDRPTITLTPALPYYTVNAPRLGYTSTGGVYDVDFGHNQVLIERDPGSRNLVIVGDVAAKYPPEKDELAIDNPAEYAAMAFKAALEEHGVTVRGGTRTLQSDSGFIGSFLEATHQRNFFAARPDFFTPKPRTVCSYTRVSSADADPETHVLAEHLSPPLGDDLKLTLKVSQNLHAEVMLRNIAAERDCEPTLRRSVQLVREFILHAGVDGDDFEFYDGSGLSTKDIVTPRATAKLLSYASTQPWFAQWKASLPTGGEDGTLRSRFGDKSPLKDHVFAKTGTLGESRALSGYLDAASGKTLIFSIFVDTHTPTTSADRVAMDAIVEAIAAAN